MWNILSYISFHIPRKSFFIFFPFLCYIFPSTPWKSFSFFCNQFFKRKTEKSTDCKVWVFPLLAFWLPMLPCAIFNSVFDVCPIFTLKESKKKQPSSNQNNTAVEGVFKRRFFIFDVGRVCLKVLDKSFDKNMSRE